VKTLLFSTLYPNQIQPNFSIFVENRLQQLLASGEADTKIIAPVPWFPFKNNSFGKYAKYAQVASQENRHGVDVFHPRYLVIPRIGMNLAPETLFRSALPVARKILDSGFDFDLIDAHYFYPDGVAAIKLGNVLNKPVVITARGTDLNLIPEYKKAREKIIWAAQNAKALITVCQALKDVLVNFGIANDKITVLRNGVDLEKFKPSESRDLLRKELGITGRTLLSVGHLVERKGHHLIIKAMASLPDFSLLIAGDGEEMIALASLVKELKLGNRVTMLGSISHADLAKYYAAVDALVLASSREGWANVLLESMACGTPVAATNIWGTPEVVNTPEAGVLIRDREPNSIAASVLKLFENYPDREKTRQYAERFDWTETTQGQLKIFNKVLSRA